MTNRELIRLIVGLEKEEEDFINKLLLIRIKKDLITKMLKSRKVNHTRLLTTDSYSVTSV